MTVDRLISQYCKTCKRGSYRLSVCIMLMMTQLSVHVMETDTHT